MFKNLISSIAGFASGAYIYIIVAAISGIIAAYAAYDLTSDYYVAKIEHANIQALKEKDDIQRQGDQLVAGYVKQVEQLSNNNTSIQRQIPMALVSNHAGDCVVPNGFVRLFNASGTGTPTSPSGTDGDPSGIDIATLLSVVAENNTKYNQVAQQLIDLQAFENTK